MKKISNAAAILGAIGGSSRSAAKQSAARENGSKGGRPRVYLTCHKCGLTWNKNKVAGGHVCPSCDYNTESA